MRHVLHPVFFLVVLMLSIHEDIPADERPPGYSMPGEVLWYRDFQLGEFGVDMWADQILEGWMNPPAAAT